MTIEEIERLHKTGKMPDWIYYAQNGKSPTQNWWEQRQKVIDKIKGKEQIDKELEIYKARRKAEIDNEIDQQIEDELTPKIEKVIDSLLSDWQ